MTLHFNLHRGTHGHMDIMFQTFSKLSIIVHGLLVLLQPPLKRFPEKSSVFQRILPNWWTKAKIPTLESVIFGKNFKKKLTADGKGFVIEEKYLQHAYRFLSTLRSCLLLSYDGLYSYCTSVSETLPSSCKLELEKLDMKARLSELSDKVTEIEDANDLAEAINGTLIELSAQLLNLWGIFLRSSLESEQEKKQIKVSSRLIWI
ncbi:protein FAM135A-like [Xenopus laevis]|uniref:Protein FAM135A-like n=1 Tax=Xenopus laevis TaxID=8355 RepID=A0A8J0TAK9_XENLA|nr:protein FAM135A-like [Xenopus laevis]